MGRLRQSARQHHQWQGGRWQWAGATDAERRARTRTGHLQSIYFTCVLGCAGTIQFGRGTHRLASSARAGAQHRRQIGCGRSLLPKKPLARRICFRPRLGRSLCPRRRQLLPEAAGLRAIHARNRTAPLGARGGQSRIYRPRACLGPGRDLQNLRRVRRARDFCTRSRVSSARRTRLSAADRSAVSLGKSRLREFRRFSGGANRA